MTESTIDTEKYYSWIYELFHDILIIKIHGQYSFTYSKRNSVYFELHLKLSMNPRSKYLNFEVQIFLQMKKMVYMVEKKYRG